MKPGTRLRLRWFLGFFWILAWASIALATPPSTPITVHLELSHVPTDPHEWAVLTVEVRSVLDAPDTYVELILPDGVSADRTNWVVNLQADTPVTLTPTWRSISSPGNYTISVRALKFVDAGAVWGDMKSISFHSTSVAAASKMGLEVDNVPVASLSRQGSITPISMEPTPFLFPSLAERVPSPEELPSAEPAQNPKPISPIPSSPGTVTLIGKWRYADRSNIARDLDQQLIEIRKGDGSALSPPTYCFTDVNGSFSCSITHPGTTMRVWVRSYMNFGILGINNRVGVFSGPEVIGGCGSDAIDCSYTVQTGEVSCANGATCDIGTWTIETTLGEPWLGAHQMTQDLIRSWKKLWFDASHPSGTSAGPGRIQYPVPANHGTHAHVPPADGWISIEPPSQQSADIVNHEYGHVVMANLWTNYSPNWPPFDCPSSHFIGIVSGPGCALFEGFANFWAWYSNEFYDGDDLAANDGPVFNWPSGASTNVETRDGGSYQAGDQVEGNIAAVFGDMYDITNDGPLQGPVDRLSDGIQHIWRTTFSQSDNNFSEWWNAYWSTSNLNPCPAFQILQFNTIRYTLSQCTQPQQTCAFSCETSFLPGCLGPGWGAVGGLTPSAPNASVNAAGHVRLFARGVDNGIWQNIDPGNGFTGWIPLGGLTESSLTSMVDTTNRVRLFARGVDNGIWQNIDPGNGFTGWIPLGGLTPDALSATLDGANCVRLFARGTDDGIWQNRDCGGGFQGWSTVGGLTPSAPAVVIDAAGHIRLFARGVDNGIWQNIDPGNGFTGWAPLGGLTHTSVASVLDDNDDLHLYTRGVDQRVWENVLPAGASCGWTGWQPIRAGGLTPSGPAAVSDVSGVVRLFVQGTDAGIYEVDSQ